MARRSMQLAQLSLVLAAAVVSMASAALNYDPSWRRVQLSGRGWVVKSSGNELWGPGPNRWSPSVENVFVDAQGRLHMKITQRGGQWYAAEVISEETLGFGRYEWEVAEVKPANSSWDANTVLGLFTWSNDPAYTHREIDVEVAKWSNPQLSTNSQFVVQPYHQGDHLQRFQSPSVAGATYMFTWMPDRVDFLSTWTNAVSGAQENATWTFVNGTGKQVPQSGDENARINLWLTPNATYGTQSGSEVEVVLSRFTFTSLQQLQATTSTATSPSSSSATDSSSVTSASGGAASLPGLLWRGAIAVLLASLAAVLF